MIYQIDLDIDCSFARARGIGLFRALRWYVLSLLNKHLLPHLLRPRFPSTSLDPPLFFVTYNHMDPSSPEAQAILQHYDVPYDDVISYQSHHQVGIYVSAPAKIQK